MKNNVETAGMETLSIFIITAVVVILFAYINY